MRWRVLVLIVVALVGVTATAAAAAAMVKDARLTTGTPPRFPRCGQTAYLGHGAEWWHYQYVAARHGWRKANAHGQKHPARYRTHGCPASVYRGHGPEWWHAKLVRLSDLARRHVVDRVKLIVKFALSLAGTPYLWGGTTPRGFDCSGFVRYVYARVGVSLPHLTYAQETLGKAVRAAAIRPGDVLFFFGGEHEGIYIGGGRFIDAPHTGAVVGVHPVAWYGPFKARRFV